MLPTEDKELSSVAIRGFQGLLKGTVAPLVSVDHFKSNQSSVN